MVGKHTVTALGALLAISCGGSPTSSSPTVFSLSGQVTSALTSSPIAGATVAIADGPDAGKSAVTDGSGNYGFTGLAQGNFNATITADGFVAKSQVFSLTSNQTVPIQLTGVRTLVYSRAQSMLLARRGTGYSFKTSRSGRLEIESSWSNASNLVRLEFALQTNCGAPQYVSGTCTFVYADRSAVAVARRTATIDSVAPNDYIVWLTNQGSVDESVSLDVYLTP